MYEFTAFEALCCLLDRPFVNFVLVQEGDRLSDEDLLKFLSEIKKTSAPQRRIKTIPGHFSSYLTPVKEILICS